MPEKRLFSTAFSLLLIILGALFYSDHSLAQERSATLSLSFSKPSYAGADSLLATVWIDNKTPQTLRNVSLNLEVKPREFPPPVSSPRRKPKSVLKTTRVLDLLQTGITRLEVQQSLAKLEIAEGIYPVSLTLLHRRKVLASLDTHLVIVNPRVTPPLLVALVWNLHEPAHFDPDGVYLDQKIAEECRSAADNRGIHAVYTSALAKHALIQTNMNLSPILLDQLQDVADGFSLKHGEGVVQIPDTSAAASDARRALGDYENLIKTGQLELLPSPYAYPYLPDLADWGWESDILAQIRKGQIVSKDGLNIEDLLEGIYPPGLAISQSSVPLLEKSKVKYLVLREENVGLPDGTSLPILEPVILQEGQAKVTAFLVNGDLSKSLFEPASTEAVVQKLLAKLAALYLNQPEIQKIVVIAPLEENQHPSPASLEALYGAIGQTAWLKTVTLSSALKSFPTAGKVIKAKPPERTVNGERDSFFQKLDQARRDWLFFAGLVSFDNPIKSKLEYDLLVAEASDWTQANDSLRQRFVEGISQIVSRELSKITTPHGQKFTFTNDAGKVRVAFINANSYIINAEIALSGDGFSFPQGKKSRVALRPKENLFDFQIKTKQAGKYPLKVTLHRDGRVIAETVIEVRSTYFDRLTCALGVFALVLVILIAVRRLRQRQLAA